MIVYQLACDHDHFFEGWFASSEACEKQVAAGQLQCPACASLEVRKLPSAPYVRSSHGPAAESSAPCRPTTSAAPAGLRTCASLRIPRCGAVRRGKRRIHYKEEKEHNIRGVVSHDEALNRTRRDRGHAIPGDVPPPSEEIHDSWRGPPAGLSSKFRSRR
jgi:hypothetical protein